MILLRYGLVIFLATTFTYAQPENILAKLKKQGFTTSLSEVEKKYYPPISGKNAADIYLKAFKLVPSNKSHHKKIVDQVEAFIKENKEIPKTMQKTIGKHLGQNRQILTLLKQAQQIEQCRFPLDFSQGYAIKRHSVLHVKYVAELLELEAVTYIANNKPDLALQKIQTCLQCSQRQKSIPILICYIIGTLAEKKILNCCQYLMNQCKLSKAQIQTLSNCIQKMLTGPSLEPPLSFEMATGIDVFQKIKSGKIFELNDGKSHILDKIKVFAYRASGKFDQDYSYYINHISLLLNICKVNNLSRQTSQIQTIYNLLSKSRNDATLIRHVLLPNYRGFFTDNAEHIVLMRCFQVAIAIEKYKEDNGNYPKTLSQLTPKHLKRIPQDCYSSQWLQYWYHGNYYKIYGVGKNLRDNRGTADDVVCTVYVKR